MATTSRQTGPMALFSGKPTLRLYGAVIEAKSTSCPDVATTFDARDTCSGTYRPESQGNQYP